MTVREYVTRDGRCPFREWLRGLDRTFTQRIQARVLRFELGNLGDSKALGGGVHEARFDFGPGFRLYFGREGETIVLLLCGGDKSTQSKDIDRARVFWKEYLESSDDKKKPGLE
jgi:putative addiction module killer protein